jgi:hypothetical protein
MEGGPQTSLMNKKKLSFALKKTTGNSEVDWHTCATHGKTITQEEGKLTGFDVLKCSRRLYENCSVYAN